MKRTPLRAGFAALSIAAPAALATLAPAVALGAPPTPSSVTIAVTGNPITIGSSSTISGIVTGKHASGTTVTLESKPAPYSAAFSKLATATADSTGHYTFKVTPTINTMYEAVAKTAPAATSSGAVVKVRVAVTDHLSTTHPAAGHAVRFTGFVLPAYNGKSALIQRKTASGWKTVARCKLVAAAPLGTTARSRYSKSVAIRHSGTYRVSFNPADGLRLANSARSHRVTVH